MRALPSRSLPELEIEAFLFAAYIPEGFGFEPCTFIFCLEILPSNFPARRGILMQSLTQQYHQETDEASPRGGVAREEFGTGQSLSCRIGER